MLRSALIFLTAILLPSLTLAFLAVRSARDQQVLLEHQQAIISQDVTDRLAKSVDGQIDAVRSEFVQTTQTLLDQNKSGQSVTADFDRQLRSQWLPAEVGFVVDLRGNIYSPTSSDGPAARTFREENERFLSNRENVEVYYTSLNSQNLVARQSPNRFLSGGNNTLTYNAGNNSLSNNAGNVMNNADNYANTTNNTAQKAPQLDVGPIAGNDSADDTGMPAKPAAADAVSPPPGTLIVNSKSIATDSMTSDVTTPSSVPASTVSVTGGGSLTPKLKAADQNANAKLVVNGGFGSVSDKDRSADAAATTLSPYRTTTTGMTTTGGGTGGAYVGPQNGIPSPGQAGDVDFGPHDGIPGAGQGSGFGQASATKDGAATREKDGEGLDTGSEQTSQATTLAGASVATDIQVPAGQAAIQSQSQQVSQIARQVMPQNGANDTTLSNTLPEESDFRRLIGDDTSGAVARFLDNKLHLMVWYRPATTGDLVFGAQLNQSRLIDRLRTVVQAPEFQDQVNAPVSPQTASYCLALLDDMGQPVALSIPNFAADWKHPFVATEIGETLPHWEAALYLTDPAQMSKSAQTLQLTIGLIVLLLVVAIVAGGSLIAADIRRKIILAQQKTDFVSNVSHELKTPLTSIRMFADLLSEGRVSEPARQSAYLKIISAESARLTRLINNVLDFARQERGEPAGERRPCDLVETTRDVVETCLPHLEANGQNLSCEIEAEKLPLMGDRDALSQIVLNLISNAEKYGGGEIVVRVRRQETAAGALGCVDVLDRGPGIPPQQVEAIFLPFHRLHDSLANGIPGSGLGLTLARRMARVHGGNISYSPRAGGGSCFTLSVPLSARAT